jgi:aminoglycoside phosphotransferase (APT) family kinase protein
MSEVLRRMVRSDDERSGPLAAATSGMTGRPTTSTREIATLRDAVAAWLRARLDADAPPDVTVRGRPAAGGFSSETVLLDVAWRRAGEQLAAGFVLRMPPPPDAYPLFPDYDLERQASAMRLVGSRTTVPVPVVPWIEPDPDVIGSPFFVMEQIDGVTASDIPPYTFGGWMAEASPGELDRLERGVVDVLAGIHGITATAEELAFLELDGPGETALRRHVVAQERYYDWIRGDARFPVIEATFGWLDRHWPSEPGPDVVSWGDARLANILCRDFVPVAVLDWEAAAIGPCELDLGWMLFFHQYFQRVAERYGHPGMPGFLTPDRVVAAYEQRTGRTIRDLEWYLVYAELRQALTSIRVSGRAVHFGEREPPADLQDLIQDRAHLEEIANRP